MRDKSKTPIKLLQENGEHQAACRKDGLKPKSKARAEKPESLYNNNNNRISLSSAPSSETQDIACSKHGKPLDIHCVNCDENLCTDCALFYEKHQGHKFAKLALALNSLQQVPGSSLLEIKSKVEKIIEGSAELAAQFNKSLPRKRDELLDILNKGFGHIRDELNKAYELALAALESNYEIFQKSFGAFNESFLQKAKQCIADAAGNERPYNVIRGNLSQLERMMESMSAAVQLDNQLFVHFDNSAVKALAGYCQLVCFAPPMKHSLSAMLFPDDNDILQDSCNDTFLKEIADTLTAVEESPAKPKSRHAQNPRPSRQSGSCAPQNIIIPPLNFNHKSASNNPQGLSKTIKGESFVLTMEDISKNANPLYKSGTKTANNMSPKSNSRAKPPFDSKRDTIRFNIDQPKGVSDYRATLNGSNFRPLDQPSTKRPSHRMSAQSPEIHPFHATDQLFQSKGWLKQLSVELANCGLDDKQLELTLGDVTITPSTKCINLNGNQITDRGLKYLLKAMTCHKVETLSLVGNSLKDKALDYLLSFVKYNSSLKSVHLQDNKIDSSSSDLKAKVAKLKKLGVQVAV